MTETKERYVEEFVRSLFQHGLEGYDKETRMTDSKGVINPGGAKVFYQLNWKNEDGKVIINHPELKKVLKELPVTLYTLSRIETDEEGNPKRTPDGRSYNRVNTGLMLHMQFSDSPVAAIKARDRILEATSPSMDLRNYVEVASRIKDPDGYLKALTTIQYDDFQRNKKNLTLESIIILAVPSGPPGSAMLWSFVNKKAGDRSSMSDSLSAGGAETEGLPL